MLTFFLLLASGAVLLWLMKRSGVLFELQIERGTIAQVRGYLPPRLLSELRDIVERNQVPRGRVTARVREDVPYLIFSAELSAGVQQQMRNVLGQFRMTHFRSR